MNNPLAILDAANSVCGSILSGTALSSDHKHHEEAIRVEKENHEREKQHATSIHEKEVRMAKKLCIAERNTELKQHFQQLNADLINGNREAERDMYEQRNSQFQTIIVASTVMFGALCAVIIEGQMPQQMTQEYELLIMCTTGSSFSFLLICMVLSLQVILLSSRFMYVRASGHNRIVQDLVVDSFHTLHKMNDHLRDMEDESVDTNQMWMDHVKRVDQYMRERQKFNERLFGDLEEQVGSTHDISLVRWMSGADSEVAAGEGGMSLTDVLLGRPEGVNHESSFEHFWESHCKGLAYIALLMFYMGTVMLLISVALLVFANMRYTFDNVKAGIVFMVFIFLSVMVTIYILYTSAKPHNIRAGRPSLYGKGR